MGVIRLDKTTRRVLVKEGSEVPFSMGTAIKLNGIDTIIDNINVTLGDTYGIAFWVDIATLSAADLIGDIPASFINSVLM